MHAKSVTAVLMTRETTSIPRLKAYIFLKKSQTMSSLTKFLEESINKYDIS
jgi:hypothetical protein